MIRLIALPRPVQLTDAMVEELTALFESDSNIRVWNKPFITNSLLEMSDDKCCYCECKVNEESKYMEVEHFFCKDLYPEKVIEWENLLPSCKRCNINKGNHDVGLEPIIHPVINEPREHLTLKAYRFYAKTPLGKTTISVLDLNDIERLQQKRFEVGSGVTMELEELEMFIEVFLENPSSIRRTKICSKLRRIMQLGQPNKEYSATVATAILTGDLYYFAKNTLNDLGLWDAEFEQLENGLQSIAFL